MDVDIPTGILTCVTGVAGSGKSSLIREVFAKQYENQVVLVDQSAITATGRSTACTYLGFFDEIRQLFGKANHGDSGLFSFNSEGKCPACKGRGVIVTELVFMDPVTTVCEECEGKRYSKKALDKLYHGKSIVDILDMSVEDALEFFEGIADSDGTNTQSKELKKIICQLAALIEVGLPYLSLGQPLSTLSGGERKRIELALTLAKNAHVNIFDEPESGIDMWGFENLTQVFAKLKKQKKSVIFPK